MQISGRREYIRQRIPLASKAGHPRQHHPHLLHLPIFLAPHSATTSLRRYQRNLLRIHPSIIASPAEKPASKLQGKRSPSSRYSILLISPSRLPLSIPGSIRKSRSMVKNMAGRARARNGDMRYRRLRSAAGKGADAMKGRRRSYGSDRGQDRAAGVSTFFEMGPRYRRRAPAINPRHCPLIVTKV